MTLVLQAKRRLLAEPATEQSHADDDAAKSQLNRRIDNKKEQVRNLKRGMPSRQNRMKVSPEQRNQTEKNIFHTKEEISDLRLQKSKIGN